MVELNPEDILAANPLGRALYSELYRDPVRPANHARFAFLDPHAQDFWVDWERAANDTVGGRLQLMYDTSS